MEGVEKCGFVWDMYMCICFGVSSVHYLKMAKGIKVTEYIPRRCPRYILPRPLPCISQLRDLYVKPLTQIPYSKRARAQAVRVTLYTQLKMNSLVTGALAKSGLSRTQLHTRQSRETLP